MVFFRTIRNNYIGNPDTFINLSWLEVNALSHTPKQTSITNVENGIYNLQLVTQCFFWKEIYRIEHSSNERDRQYAVEEFHDLIYDQVDSCQYVLEKLCDKAPRGKNRAELQKVIDIFKIIKKQTHINIPIEDL